MKKMHKLIALTLAILLLLIGCTNHAPTEGDRITIVDIMEKYSATELYKIVDNPAKFLDDLLTINYYPDVSKWEYDDKIYKAYIKEYNLAEVRVEMEKSSDGEVLTERFELCFDIVNEEANKRMYENCYDYFVEKWGEPSWISDDSDAAAWNGEMYLHSSTELGFIILQVGCADYVADGVVTDY